MAFQPTPGRRSVASREPDLDLGRKHRPDYWLVILSLGLLSIGLIVVYAISPALAVTKHVSSNYFVTKQLVAIGLSAIAFICTYKIPLSWWRSAYRPIAVFAGLATLLALIIPENPDYPAHRWVRLGGFSFQSVELVKFALLLWLAGFLAQQIQRNLIGDFKSTLRPILIALGGIGVIVVGVQSDLGSTGVMVVMMATMSYVAGLPLRRILLIGAIILIGLTLAISAIPYRRARLAAYLHPSSNCQTVTGYQACQAIIGVGSGGIIGQGLGSGVQAYGYLPEAANDSIFAIYAEKFGFVGSIVLLALFVAFFARLKLIAERLSDNFSRLLVMGVLAWLSTQVVINVGAMIGLLPLKGITLPFISYGGTSVVFVVAAVGLVFQASQYTSFVSPRVRNEPTTRRAYNSSARRTAP